MKKAIRMLCAMLTVFLLFASGVTVLAKTETVTPLYDNSFLLTLETTYSLDLESYLGVDHCVIKGMEIHSDYYLYRVQAVVLQENVEDAMKRVASLSGVTKVERNTLAKDYWQKASYLRLNETALAIPLGETVTVKINQANLQQNQYQAVGVEVRIDPQKLPYGLFCGLLSDLSDQITILALYEEDLAHEVFRPYLMYYHYTGTKDSSYFSGPALKRINIQSPIQRYLVVGADETIHNQLLTRLSNMNGCYNATMVYTLSQGNPQQEWWVENEQTVTVHNAHGNENGQFITATLTGKQVGETLLTVWYGDDEESVTATCFIKVYDPPWNPPTRLGDLNGDGKISAKDALEVLWYTVYKHSAMHWSVTPENLMRLERAKWYGMVMSSFGNVNGDSGVSAKDALEILKYAVGKITQFPVEEIVETPTAVK